MTQRTDLRRDQHPVREGISGVRRAGAADLLYYSGQKDLQEKALRAELADSDDVDRSTFLRAQLAMLLRGQKRWAASERELRPTEQNLGSVSRASRAFVDAAEGALLLERGCLTAAAEKLEDALRYFGRSHSYQELRQYVSSAWKGAELHASRGCPTIAMARLAHAQSVAEEIGDLHGYCNARIAEAHVALSQGNFKRAVAALMWASHPPPAIKTDQPHPRFIAGELARAWAVVEWKHQLERHSWLGYVHPLWALEFAAQCLHDNMSFVMRVPFLGRWAIASPSQFHDAILEHAEMIPRGHGSRPRFSSAERERIFKFYGGLCALCGVRINEDAAWHVDHIVLHSMGHAPKRTAANAFLNYRPVHAKCNLIRGADDFWYLKYSYRNNPTMWVERAWRRLGQDG